MASKRNQKRKEQKQQNQRELTSLAKGCQKKAFYKTLSEANMAAMKAPLLPGQPPKRGYECRHCPGHHFGSDWEKQQYGV